MKKVVQRLRKFVPAFATCMAIVLTMNANSSVSYFFHQSKSPKGLDEFKRIK